MKKLLSMMMLLFVCIFVTGCEKLIPEREYLTIYGETEMYFGQTITLTHNYKGSREVEWKSLNPKIATVDNGIVTPVGVGTATITLTVGNSVAKYDIRVKEINAIIVGPSTSYVTKTDSYSIKAYNEKGEVDVTLVNRDDVEWSVDNPTIASIGKYGAFRALQEGTVTITAKFYGQSVSMTVQIGTVSPTIRLTGPKELSVGESSRISVGVSNPTMQSMGNVVAEVDNKECVTIYAFNVPLEVVGMKEGTVTIKVYFSKYPDAYDEITINVVDRRTLTILGADGEMNVGETKQLNVYPSNQFGELVWESLMPNIATIDENGLVKAVSSGLAIIKVYFEDNPNISTTYYIDVKEEVDPLEQVNEIISKMTLSQKVGQMFTIGFSGTTYTSTLASVIKEYNFGNVIYMGANVASPETIAQMSNDIQKAMIESNIVPAFISTDQEGGRVARLTNGGTHFISNMAMGALNDITLIYEEGVAMGYELRNYGINANFAPVLDVNNNPENPIIGIRSYGENPFLVAKCGVQMFKGLACSNVMGVAKHFPGHGNTNVDSHTGLPIIKSTKEELYKIELAPYVKAIEEGIDAIMTTHIIFTAIDENLPATLSEKVLTNLLREELGYDGIIITDGMEMNALSNFGNHGELAVQAVKAGVDILLYTSNTNPRAAHQAIVDAVNNKEISMERIDESVRRILLKKLKYGLLDDATAPNLDMRETLQKNEELNNLFAMKSLTQMKGSFEGFDKNESILVISPTTSYNLGSNLENNSVACYVSTYLKAQGYNSDYYVINNNVSTAQANAVMSKIVNYDKVVIACSNVKTNNYASTKNLVNDILKEKEDTIVIALDTPYDYLVYENLNNYICVYGYQKATSIAIAKYLNGEFKAEGISPINFTGE